MKTLLNKWEPKRWFGKAIKVILNIIRAITTIILLVIPFLKLEGGWLEAFKWIWIVCAILNLDDFADYKKARAEKLISPTFSVYTLFTFLYLCNYWNLIPLSVAIVVPLVIGTLEVAISISVHKAFRFTTKQELKLLPKKVTDGILLGSVYVSALALFVLGHFLDEKMIFIYGIICIVMLFSSVISVISKGFNANKSLVSTIGIIVDILSVLALIGYLIYLTPNEDGLQDIVLSLTSAVIGGAVTLAGVAWTIKKTDDDRKAEEKKKAEPLFTFNLLFDDKIPETHLICSACASQKDEPFYSHIAHICNSDNSNFYICSIKYKNDWYDVANANCVIKNREVYFVFYAPEISEETLKTYIRVKDILGYYHFYEVEYQIRKNKKSTQPYAVMISMKKTTEEKANG
jgi:hypothetical protein